jgi:hypothetical protein
MIVVYGLFALFFVMKTGVGPGFETGYHVEVFVIFTVTPGNFLNR